MARNSNSDKATIGERIIERLGGMSKSEYSQAMARAYESGYSDGGEDEPVSGTTKKYGYRRTTTAALRDFTKMDHESIIETVWSLWQSNPVAKRVLVIKRGYILGSGVHPQSGDPDLQAILTEFWMDNQLPRRSKEFTLQLFLFGEQCYPAYVRMADGKASLGYIDPGSIKQVVTHPENSMEMWAVVVKGATNTGITWMKESDKDRVYRIIREDQDVVNGEEVVAAKQPGKLVMAEQANQEPWEETMLKSFGLTEYSGSCFFEKVNSVSNQPRGYSDLLQVADWLDQADETLFALADREQMGGYFSWDVTLENADPKVVKTREQEIRAKPPKKGSVNVHNDAETWEMKAPDLKQKGTIETYNALLTLVLGGSGLPRHWFGYGDETNRATAEAQGDPTWRSLEDDQAIVKGMLLRMCQFARDQAEIAGRWKPADAKEESRVIDIQMPEMTAKDVSRFAVALAQFAAALLAAEDSGWIRHETAATVWAKLMGEIGVEVDPAAELEAIQKEQTGEALEAEKARNERLTRMLERALESNGKNQQITDEALLHFIETGRLNAE